MHWILWVFIFGLCDYHLGNAQQRVAPGVPPQHYQQPPQQVHHQHVPQQQAYQQQQPPVHQQYQPQVPPQHVPVQQQQQHQQQQPHVPVQHHPHGHAHDQPPQQLLNAANIAQEKDHIVEHMEVPIDTSKMTDQELQFHYFKMHDADNNNKLDGCELIKSLIHWHEQGNKDPNQTHQTHQSQDGKIFTDDELSNLIDPILTMDDANKDGFIDYLEFVQAQQKAAANERQ